MRYTFAISLLLGTISCGDTPNSTLTGYIDGVSVEPSFVTCAGSSPIAKVGDIGVMTAQVGKISIYATCELSIRIEASTASADIRSLTVGDRVTLLMCDYCSILKSNQYPVTQILVHK
jgi:hypothetical protein